MGGRTGTGRARRRIGALTTTAIVGAASAVASIAPVAVPAALAAPPTPQLTGDVNLSPASSSVDQLTYAGTSGLFFIADDGVHGTELWVTDGVAGANGDVCIFTLAATDVIVDVNGYVPEGASPATVVPARLLETRVGEGLDTVDGQFEGVGRQGAGTALPVTVTGRGGVPGDADAVMVNVTAVFPDGPGYVTVFPCGEPQPLASSVNDAAGQVVPNAVLAKVGSGGRICVYTSSGTDLLVDVTGHL